jgi:hypothetical protein
MGYILFLILGERVSQAYPKCDNKYSSCSCAGGDGGGAGLTDSPKRSRIWSSSQFQGASQTVVDNLTFQLEEQKLRLS